jgi:hypothetical protein
MEYGKRRDYKAIDIFVDGIYSRTTTWARNLKIAREKAAESLGVDVSRIVAHYA